MVFQCFLIKSSMNGFPMATLWDSRSPPLIPAFPSQVWLGQSGWPSWFVLQDMSADDVWCMICMMYVHARIVSSCFIYCIYCVFLFDFPSPARLFGSFQPKQIKQQPGGQHSEAIIASRDDLDPFMDSMDEMRLRGNGWENGWDTWTDENAKH